jgi:cytochrome d ubiquinol oxidase subunit I
MKTSDGVSPSVGTTQIVMSLTAFYGIYIALGAVNVFLMTRFARRGLEETAHEPSSHDEPGPRVPVLTY